jgi:hypothetical protein
MLKDAVINIEDLLLDPNNPRFRSTFSIDEKVVESDLEKLQKKTLEHFSEKKTTDNEDATNVEDLYESMTTIGYVPIDRIVVMALKNQSKYLVVEGNRRISTIKIIRDHLAKSEGKFSKRAAREAADTYKDTFEKISCMVLETEGISEDEIAHNVSIVLGLRHHGSLLEWEPLPSAFNIYREYMGLEQKLPDFTKDTAKINTVASALSIKRGKVITSLKTYIVYMQLSEHFDVKDRYFSLILAGVTNANLKTFINIDEEGFLLDEPSIDRMNQACQFEYRDSIPVGKKKILEEPKSFGRLGQLFKLIRNSADEAVKDHGRGLVERVLDEDDVDMTVDDAVDQLIDMEKKRKWAETMTKLLDRQEKELKPSDYQGVGNDRARKDELKPILQRLSILIEHDS